MSIIGSGSFAKIYKVKRLMDNKIFAVKEIFFKSLKKSEKAQIVNEVNIMRELHSDYLVKYIKREVDQSNGLLWIVMEYCQGGDLYHYLKAHTDLLHEDFIWILLAQVNEGLTYLHANKIIHRDIKPHNILFVDMYKLRIKIADFGLSTITNTFSVTYAGSPYYMSPEMTQSNPYNEKIDIWALGCLSYQLACRNPPFDAENHTKLKEKILIDSFEPLPAQYSNLLLEFVVVLLNKNQMDRPTSDQIGKHYRITLALFDLKLKCKEIQLTLKEKSLFKAEHGLQTNRKRVRQCESSPIRSSTSL